MNEEQAAEETVDPVEQARQEGHSRGRYEGMQKVRQEVLAKLYEQVRRYHPHHEGLIVVRELITNSPFDTMDIPEGMTPLSELELKGYRVYNKLMREGIKSIELLLTMSEADLLDLGQFAQKSLDEVKEALAKRELELKPL